MMTELLERAMARVAQLAPEEQDAIAARILLEVADDEAWEQQFAATTEEHWAKMAARVREEIAAGKTAPLEVLFSPRKPEP